MKPIDDLERFFEETDDLAAVRALASKKILAADIEQMMKEQGVSKAELARKMHTSRPVVDRLLDPNNTGITLITLAKAAAVLGGQLRFQM